MFRRVITIVSVAVALIGASATRASAACPVALTGPFCIDGVVTDADNSQVGTGATKVTDPNGSSKELGPINGSTTKIGVINTAPTPMLGLTNPNAQVDLNTIYTQTAPAANGDIWFYFAWRRDSNSGSGFISIELEKTGVPLNCTGASGYSASNCNPWSGRSTGDFLILWDQNGGSTDILKRVFTSGLGFGGAVSFGGSAFALYSSDGFSGEAAINFSASVFPSTGECLSFANTIPGTVTGNSDTADYKDAVLSAFPPVSNCGSVTITKATQPTNDLTGTFPYTLSALSGDIFDGVIDSECDSATDKAKCQNTLTKAGDSNTIENLLPKSNYTLVEDSTADPKFELFSIQCTAPGGSTYSDIPAGGFSVAATKTTACVITNKVKKGTPSQTTNQFGRAQILDEIRLTGVQSGGSGATARFKLYSDATCTTLQTNGDSGALAVVDDGSGLAHATMTTAISITPGSTYYWRVEYSGDTFNNGFTTACGSETGLASFTFTP